MKRRNEALFILNSFDSNGRGGAFFDQPTVLTAVTQQRGMGAYCAKVDAELDDPDAPLNFGASSNFDGDRMNKLAKKMKREKKGKDILIKTKPGAGDGSSKEAQEVESDMPSERRPRPVHQNQGEDSAEAEKDAKRLDAAMLKAVEVGNSYDGLRAVLQAEGLTGESLEVEYRRLKAGVTVRNERFLDLPKASWAYPPGYEFKPRKDIDLEKEAAKQASLNVSLGSVKNPGGIRMLPKPEVQDEPVVVDALPKWLREKKKPHDRNTLVEGAVDGDEAGGDQVVDGEQVGGGRRRPSTAEDVAGNVTGRTGGEDDLSNFGSMPPKSRSMGAQQFQSMKKGGQFASMKPGKLVKSVNAAKSRPDWLQSSDPPQKVKRTISTRKKKK